MTNIDKALHLIDILKRDEITLDGLMITNSVNKHFGYLYVRTELDFIVDTILYPDDRFISYQIYGRHTLNTAENQEQCNKVFEEQKRDIEILKEKILSHYPSAEIAVVLSPYFCHDYSECLLTGEIQYSDVPNPIQNGELKMEYERALTYIKSWGEVYKSVINRKKRSF